MPISGITDLTDLHASMMMPSNSTATAAGLGQQPGPQPTGPAHPSNWSLGPDQQGAGSAEACQVGQEHGPWGLRNQIFEPLHTQNLSITSLPDLE